MTTTESTDKTDKRPSFAEQLAEKIIAELEKGTSPLQQPWINSPRPYNASTGKPYRGANRLMLMVQDYKDPRYMTFYQAKEAGYSIKKGSRGISLQKYIWEKEEVKTDEQGNPIKDENGDIVKEKVRLNSPIVNHFTVFNAEQINGIPPLELGPTKRNWDLHEVAEEILKASGAVIKHEQGDRAYYSPSRDEIVLPHQHQFPSAQNYYDVALHELGHWTGHESRLNRLTTTMFGTQEYAKEELRAEIASMMLGQDLGISHDTSNHISYVASWIQVIKDSPYELVKACNDAERISDYVLDFAPEHVKDQINNRNVNQEVVTMSETEKTPQERFLAAKADFCKKAIPMLDAANVHAEKVMNGEIKVHSPLFAGATNEEIANSMLDKTSRDIDTLYDDMMRDATKEAKAHGLDFYELNDQFKQKHPDLDAQYGKSLSRLTELCDLCYQRNQERENEQEPEMTM